MFNFNFINPLNFCIMSKNSFDFEAHLSRHPHNVSAGYTSSLTTGPIVPQYFDILGPGDTLYFTPKCFARLQDIVAPFFGEVDIHFDAFFVPLSMLYTAFGQVFAQTNDVLSSFFTHDQQVNVPESFPVLKTTWKEGVDVKSFYYGHKECIGKELMRLLDSLDCNSLSVLTQENVLASGYPQATPALNPVNYIPPSVSPWLFAAYQAIYQKEFRNDDLERFDIDSYNVDKYFLSTEPFTEDRLYRLRYCQRPSDYFTNLKVSPIASAVNSVVGVGSVDQERFPSEGGVLSNTLTKVNNYLGFGKEHLTFVKEGSYPSQTVDVPAFGALSTDVFDGYSTNALSQSVGFLNAANIRALFAVDKFTRIYGRAGKTYDEQIQAHFGIEIPHDVKHDLTRIKHYRMSLAAEPVYSTADTGEGGSSIGQVGGQANNSLSAEQEKFTAPVHGVFMIVAHAVTKPRYFMTFNKLNMLSTRLDFPIPEFDKLGMQPLYAFECYPQFLKPFDNVEEPNSSVRIGWQRRYQQFKQKYNRVSPLYFNTDLLDDISTASNAFSPYVLSRLPISQPTILNVGEWLDGESALVPAMELFETPYALNGVMALGYDGRWSETYFNAPQSVFDTDPIIMDFYCDAKKVSWMSETGEPDL